MLCEATNADEFEDPNIRARDWRAGPGVEDVRVLRGLPGAERRCCKDALKEGRGGFLYVDFVLLREVAVESGDVAADDECKVDECEAGVWNGGRGESRREVFKREVDERRERMYADMGNDGHEFRKEEIVEERDGSKDWRKGICL